MLYVAAIHDVRYERSPTAIRPHRANAGVWLWR